LALLCAVAGQSGKLMAVGATYEARTGTVQAGPLELSLDNVTFTQKKGYVHILFDVFPYAARIQALGLKSISPVAAALLTQECPRRFPAETKFKLDVIELSQRDDYGNPEWGKVIVKERYQGQRKGAKVKVSRITEKGAAK
jgi:hypothetical protein